MATISFMLDGDILRNGKPSLHTIGTVATHFHSAISRAYLDVKTGNVRKYSRVPVEEYDNIDFWLSQTRQGSWIIDTIGSSSWGDRISQKLMKVMNPIYLRVSRGVEKDLFDLESYRQEDRETILRNAEGNIQTYSQLQKEPPEDYNLGYVDKSIARYIAQATSPVRSDTVDKASISFSVHSVEVKKTYAFDKPRSHTLQKIASERNFYDPVIYNGRIFAMDRSKQNGFFYNVDNYWRKQKLLFHDITDFIEARKYFREETDIKFVGRPCIEAGSLDIDSGDVLYIGVVV